MASFSVATLNLFNRSGGWDRRAPLVIEQLSALAPDIVGLQEVDLMLDQAMWICRQVNERLPGERRYGVKHAASPGPLAAFHGIATLSRLDVLEHEVLDLMSWERLAQRTVFEVEGGRFAVVNTHLHYPPEAEGERLRQAEYILAWLDRHSGRLPTVLLGDFNAYPHEQTVALLKGRYRSAYEAAHGGEPDKTWPTPVNTADPSPHGTVDYIFVPPEFHIAEAGLAFDQPSPADPGLYGSDHLGLFARLQPK